MKGIAIIGMACIYPGARSPRELWENILAGRQEFRRIPEWRLRLEDYFSADSSAPDAIYSTEAAVIANYSFDRVRFKIAGATYRSTDLAHWLALDVAAQSLHDAGLDGDDFPFRKTAGVYVGNTLTGEFARANLLRLRWPYVHRVIEAALKEAGLPDGQRGGLVKRIEQSYKEPFPPMTEESLAGGLSNTIAGRICNHFDLKGGGYTVDGACASSLLAIINACSALENGDLDVAIAGGVDISIDPFELVGFSKAGALAREKMRVLDARSEGFWPGEGCGFVVLMRYEEALADQRRIYAVIRGRGISSDGNGGITRPEIDGQLLALERAYRQAGYRVGSVAYFEAHATGTAVGDAVELKAVSQARRQDAPDEQPAFIGSIKANIGHTKAAAGVAGLIKATMSVYTQVLPPTTGCEAPHAELTCDKPALAILAQGRLWPVDRPLRASVSAMGFGGINTHVTLEGVTTHRRSNLTEGEKRLLTPAQDAELFLFIDDDADKMCGLLQRLSITAGRLSRSELTDLAAELARQAEVYAQVSETTVRAAVIASSPAELCSRITRLRSWLHDGCDRKIDARRGIFIASRTAAPQIGFLFPGQGSPSRRDGGVFRRRFDYVKELYDRATLPADGEDFLTSVAQPAIVTASLAGLRVLKRVAVEARAGIGHSLGEITALHWAGAINEDAVLRIAQARGKYMRKVAGPAGAMASIRLGAAEVKSLLNGNRVTISGFNSPSQTVISGETSAIHSVIELARSKGITAVTLAVSHAFHSPLVAPCAQLLEDFLSDEKFNPIDRRVFSTVTGRMLHQDEDIRGLLCRQITSPVRFVEAVEAAADGLDLFIEIGPGQVLAGLVSDFTDIPVVSLDAGGSSWEGLLKAIGAAFALGARVKPMALFADRFFRDFDIDREPQFFINPCELAPPPSSEPLIQSTEERQAPASVEEAARAAIPRDNHLAPLELLRQIVAGRAELPLSAVRDESKLLGDLHLNSITVTQLIVEAARQLNLPVPVAPSDFSNVTLAQAAETLEEVARLGSFSIKDRQPQGVDAWVRAFTVKMVESPLSRNPAPSGPGRWRVIALEGYPLKERLEKAFNSRLDASGVVVCVPPDPCESVAGLLLESVRAVLSDESVSRFVLVQHGGGAASFARSLYLEMPGVETCVVDVPINHPSSVDWVIKEAECLTGFAEAHYDDDGCRREPFLSLLDQNGEEQEILLDEKDLLLVSGGGKGIVAECALALAKQTKAGLVLIGRSSPDENAELESNLRRMKEHGIRFAYLVADVTDKEALSRAVAEAQANLGEITGILHGAGTNYPQLLKTLDEEMFSKTLAAKIQGARNLLAAVKPEKLKLFISFGSLIARTGLRGEADYAVANELLGRVTEEWQASHPDCRCLNIEWSIWSGVGMGQRLGAVETLTRQGITPITVDQGVQILLDLLTRRLPAVSVVVTGRFGQVPTARLENRELPLLRFLERPVVHYPGIELVVDIELYADSDPYLLDHQYQGRRLFPAVMGLEAMAQVAKALAARQETPVFENVKFDRPIIVPDNGPLTIRIAGLARGSDQNEVVIRSEETGFQADHFSAICKFPSSGAAGEGEWRQQADRPLRPPPADALSLDPDQSLYGRVLFQSGRFKRVRRYRSLRAKQAVAEIDSQIPSIWFGRYLPAELVLDDAGARDAAIHSIQASIPHATLLPVGVDRIEIKRPYSNAVLLANSRQRERHGDTFIYDLEITDQDGLVCERWAGLRLRRVSEIELPDQWNEVLLAAYIERRVEEVLNLLEPSPSVVVNRVATARRDRSNALIRQAAGALATVCRRPDGLPELITDSGSAVSAAHAGDITIAVFGPSPVACDVEAITHRADGIWRDILGTDRFAVAEVVAGQSNEGLDRAATRAWVVGECLKKSGAMMNTPAVFEYATNDGWAIFSAGRVGIATFVTSLHGFESQVAFGVLARRADASL